MTTSLVEQPTVRFEYPEFMDLLNGPVIVADLQSFVDGSVRVRLFASLGRDYQPRHRKAQR